MHERRPQRTTVSYRCIDAAAHAALTGSRKSLLLAIAYRANRDNFQTFAGLDDLASIAGVSRATAKRALAELVAEDWVVVVKESAQHRPRLLMLNVLKCEANQVQKVKRLGVHREPPGVQFEPSGVQDDPPGFQTGQYDPSDNVVDRKEGETVTAWMQRIAETKAMP